MPELPEVQTVVDDLNKKIKGDTITGFWSDWDKTIKSMSLGTFKKNIIGKKILKSRRIGKNIFIDLSGGKTLYIHLKMTGHLILKPENKKSKFFDEKVNQYIHHSWKLKNKKGEMIDLDFSDLRKFAKIVLVNTDKVQDLPEIKKLGIDAMDPKFNLKKFQEILNKNSARGRSALGGKPIGIVLMEQELIAGIGNIYRSEILFAAGVNPERKSGDLKKEETSKIFKEIKRILKKAIELRGTSDSDYRDTSGAPGQYRKLLRVYRKDKQKCLKCAKIILRIKMAQRSVFYCPNCQK